MHDEDITQVFEAYVEQEKAKALAILCSEERLDSIKLNGLLENYLFTDVMPREDEVAETLTGRQRFWNAKACELGSMTVCAM